MSHPRLLTCLNQTAAPNPTSLHSLFSFPKARYVPLLAFRRHASACPNIAPVAEPDIRKNQIGIQMLPAPIHAKIFPNPYRQPTHLQMEGAQKHLAEWNLLKKALDPLPDIKIDIPDLAGDTIQEHFHILGLEQCAAYLGMASKLAAGDLPPMPSKWALGTSFEGWVRYTQVGDDVKCERVQYPTDDALIFDVEVAYKISKYPVIAVAASEKHWYTWVSPGLFSHTHDKPFVPTELIPMGDSARDRVIVGHHVAYDRARIREEYSFRPTRNAFIDTMSLHSAVGGLSSQQRPAWRKYKKELREDLERAQEAHNDAENVGAMNDAYSPGNQSYAYRGMYTTWHEVTSLNSLQSVAELYLNKTIDKSIRSQFESADMVSIIENLQSLMTYCARDVQTTHELYGVIYPRFRAKCPHPVSFAGMLHISKGYLPVSDEWQQYVDNAERKFEEYQEDIRTRLAALADDAVEKFSDGSWKDNPWMRNLDWEIPVVKMTKEIIGKDGKVKKVARPYSNQKGLIGMPKWYSQHWSKKQGRLDISLNMRIAPYLLSLQWKGYPIYWTKSYGWTFVVPKDQAKSIPAKVLHFSEHPDGKTYDLQASHDTENFYYRIPHPEGDNKNCGTPLCKSFIAAFEDHTLTSPYEPAKYILQRNAQCAYWAGARQRIMDQFIVWDKDLHDDTVHADNGKQYGVILPQSIAMGTVTRRAVEATWMTAANAKKNRIGSELKAQIKSPAGYKIIGADVDSEELWIASLLGDASFKIHGGTAIGFMTLQGTKKQGTDMHTVTGNILGTSRDHAKIFNYGRIYGAGVKYAVRLLRQHSPGLSEDSANQKATNLYAKTKGRKHICINPWASRGRALLGEDGDSAPKCKLSFWHGGSESYMFNKLEEIATAQEPRTPALRCVIPEGLMPKYAGSDFMTSRVNWAVQSSGVDYLHLLLVSMDYLMRRLDIDGRFLLSIHDEVRFLVKEEQSLLAALCLQVANLWTRAMFSASVDIGDVPASVAFFSSIDIDHCLRKEVDMDCITPSNPVPVPYGRSLDVHALAEELEKIKEATGRKALWGQELRSVEQVAERLKLEGKAQGKVDKMDQAVAAIVGTFEEADPVARATMENLAKEIAAKLEEVDNAFLLAQMAKTDEEVARHIESMENHVRSARSAMNKVLKLREQPSPKNPIGKFPRQSPTIPSRKAAQTLSYTTHDHQDESGRPSGAKPDTHQRNTTADITEEDTAGASGGRYRAGDGFYAKQIRNTTSLPTRAGAVSFRTLPQCFPKLQPQIPQMGSRGLKLTS